MPDYANKAACAAWLVKQFGTDPEDFDELLELTKAVRAENDPCYRLYFVGALHLNAILHDRKLLKGKGGTTFGDPQITIRGWLAKQRTVDRLKNLTVPAGAEATLETLEVTQVEPQAPGPVFSSWR